MSESPPKSNSITFANYLQRYHKKYGGKEYENWKCTLVLLVELKPEINSGEYLYDLQQARILWVSPVNPFVEPRDPRIHSGPIIRIVDSWKTTWLAEIPSWDKLFVLLQLLDSQYWTDWKDIPNWIRRTEGRGEWEYDPDNCSLLDSVCTPIELFEEDSDDQSDYNTVDGFISCEESEIDPEEESDNTLN